MWCNPCRAVCIIHCAHPDECGNMLSDEAAADNWKAWLDDLPLDAGFSEGIGQVQDFISGTVARAEAAETALAAMTKERDGLLTTWAESRERHLTAETALAAEREKVARLVEALRTLLIAADADSYADYFNAIEAGHAALAKWDAGQ